MDRGLGRLMRAAQKVIALNRVVRRFRASVLADLLNIYVEHDDGTYVLRPMPEVEGRAQNSLDSLVVELRHLVAVHSLPAERYMCGLPEIIPLSDWDVLVKNSLQRPSLAAAYAELMRSPPKDKLKPSGPPRLVPSGVPLLGPSDTARKYADVNGASPTTAKTTAPKGKKSSRLCVIL